MSIARLGILLLASLPCFASPVWVWQGTQYFECEVYATYSTYCVADTSLPTTYPTLYDTHGQQTDEDQPYIAAPVGLFAYMPSKEYVAPTEPVICCAPVVAIQPHINPQLETQPVITPEPGTALMLCGALLAYVVFQRLGACGRKA